MHFFFGIILCIFIILLIFFYKKNFFLLDNPKLSNHKNFTSNNLAQIGGSYLFISFLTVFYFNELSIMKIEFFLFFLLFTILGVFSDINNLFSPSRRFFFQFFIVLLFIFLFDIKINNTQIPFINYFLKKNIFISYFFTIFCILVLVNGTNFIDGKNGLVIGNYILIFIFLLILIKNNLTDIYVLENIYLLILILFIIFLFNIFNFCILGDNGSYFLSFFTAIFVISYFNKYSNLNPIFALNLLWYPAFENFFSIIRRLLQKKKISTPDRLHLHNLINLFVIKIFKLKEKSILGNSLTSILINLFFFILLLISYQFYPNSLLLIFSLIFNMAIYLFFYFYIINYLKKI